MLRCLTIVLGLIFIQSLFSQEVITTHFYTANKVSIKGKIKNYHPNQDNRFVTIIPHDITGMGKDTSVYISDDGVFQAQVFQPFEGDLGLTYRKEFVYLYAGRNEQISIEIDDVKWEKRQENTDALIIGGVSASTSREMNRFKSKIDNHQFTYSPVMGNKNIADKDFTRETNALMNEQLSFLKNYVTENVVIDQKFIKWAKNEIVFIAGRNIAFNCFASKMNTTITYPQLRSLLDKIPLNQIAIPNNAYYYRFLNLLSSDLEIIANINPIYKDTIKSLGNNSILLQMHQIDIYSKNLARELMYFYKFQSQVGRKNNNAKKYKDEFGSVINDPYLSKRYSDMLGDKEEFVSYDIIQKIRKQPSSDTLVHKIEDLLMANKGSYLYLDFWGSWCGPCMNEMQYYPLLIRQLRDRPIVFVFMSVETALKEMQEIQKKHGIKGRFLQLSQNETKILSNAFGFNSYPSHFLVDPRGMLIRNDLPHIAMGTNINSALVDELQNIISK